MKKSKLKKISKQPISKIQRTIWSLCKTIIRAKYGNVCYTCGASGLTGGNWQTGHFIPKGTCGAYLRYDLRNLRPQCAKCNIWEGGQGAAFYRNMVAREGQEYVDTLFECKKLIIPNAYTFYLELIKKYKELI